MPAGARADTLAPDELGLCASGPALAAQANSGADWATAQIGEDSGSLYLSRVADHEAVPYTGPERGVDASTRAALKAAPAAL